MGNRILLAEDNRLSRLATQSILEKLGYQVVGVGDGREVVNAEATGNFDAVVMDCQMPKMDGLKATVEIRRRQIAAHSARTPIIGLSSRALDGDSDAAIAMGMDAYLTKPLSVRELRAALEEWVTNGGETPLIDPFPA